MPRGRRSKKKNRKTLDLQVVSLIIISILLAILIYTKAGYIGETLSPVLGGIMGWIKYIIPVGTFAIAVFLACDEGKENFMKKILQYAVFLLCITTIITVIQISQGKLSMSEGFEKSVEEAYENGSKNIGGGAVGAICAIALIGLVGKIGTVIIAIGVAIIDSIFLFGIKPAELLKEYVESRNERKQELKEQRLEQKKLKLAKEIIPKEEKKKKEKIMPENNSDNVSEKLDLAVNATNYLKKYIPNVLHADKRGINVIIQHDDAKSIAWNLKKTLTTDKSGFITTCPNYNRIKQKAIAIEIKNLDYSCLEKEYLDKIIEEIEINNLL